MALIKALTGMIAAAFSVDGYYKALNESLKRVGGEYTMLHYPYYENEGESFLRGQKNLTDHCIRFGGEPKGLDVLEIGCGNGVQALYVMENFRPASLTGIDLNRANIEIAHAETDRLGLKNVRFTVDDSQKLDSITSESMRFVYSIESAFHYPDKEAFLQQAYRVLAPGGTFLLADLMANHKKSRGIRKAWKKRLVLHHWTVAEYLATMERTGFTAIRTADITEHVIRGFLNYPYWFRQMEKKGWPGDFLFRIFYLINLKWYLYLLRNRREYTIISAVKRG